jgi:CRISPR-associated protein Csm2
MAEAIVFYKDKERRIINPALFSTTAENWSKEVHERAGRDANKRTQLRKFYDEVLRLNTLLKNNPADWDNVLPFVNMLIAKAVYARGRNKVTQEFEKMLKDCIAQVQKREDMEVFANFFESFMGYYRQYGAN